MSNLTLITLIMASTILKMIPRTVKQMVRNDHILPVHVLFFSKILFFKVVRHFDHRLFNHRVMGVRTATKKLHQKFFKYPFLGLNLNCHQLFKIQIQKGGKVLLWNHVKSRIEAVYFELVLDGTSLIL